MMLANSALRPEQIFDRSQPVIFNGEYPIVNPQIIKNPQLIVKRYNPNGTSFVHCLICSTAPKNAENQQREDLQAADYAGSIESLDKIKQALRQFIQSQWHGNGENVLSKISIVLDKIGRASCRERVLMPV